MSNSNPQLKEYIREHLKNMYLREVYDPKRYDSDPRMDPAHADNSKYMMSKHGHGDFHMDSQGIRQTNPILDASGNPTDVGARRFHKQRNITNKYNARQLTSANAANAQLTATNNQLTSAAAATPMAKWTAGVKGVDSKLFGNAAIPGGAASTKGLMGSGGKIGMGTKLAGAGIAAATQGLSSASTEWEENKNKGMGSGFENVAKTAVRGTVAAAGAGAGAYAGMAAGAALGSAVGPVGTLIGAAVGGIAGGWGGGALADKAADMVTNIGDNDKDIKDFQGNRDIEDIERKARTQAAKQKAEDATRVKTAPAGVDYNSNDEDQVQNFTLSSSPNRGNGPGAAGGQMFVNMNQRQRNNPR